MRKKEVRWISRDMGVENVEIWDVRPKKIGGVYVNPKSKSLGLAKCTEGRISRTCGLGAWAAIIIKAGGLARVTIERQY